MGNQTATANIQRASVISTTISTPLQLIGAFILVAAIVYAAVFVNTSAAHNEAHDMRHSQGFPCH